MPQRGVGLGHSSSSALPCHAALVSEPATHAVAEEDWFLVKGQGKLPRDPWGGLSAAMHAGPGQEGADKALRPEPQGQGLKQDGWG